MSEWKDPKDAPRDGKKVLIAYTSDGEEAIEAGWWSSRAIGWEFTGYLYCEEDIKIRGWMPLPKFPKHHCIYKDGHVICETIDRRLCIKERIDEVVRNKYRAVCFAEFCPFCGGRE